MSKEKPSLPKGMRDFGPKVLQKRNYIFSVIKDTFQRFGFQPLETPTMENLSVLTGKYGDEGDQLIFKVLNSGDFLSKVTLNDLEDGYKKTTRKISEKALRYDLTVPFARYVVMNRNEITFPFKRYQIQPVWRADRPQKGRYREFYQCDADVVGTNSLLCEAEIVLMIDEVLTKLGLTDFTIKINHRKILSGLYEAVQGQGRESDLFVAIDKLDKIGKEGVSKEISERGYSNDMIERLFSLLEVQGTFEEKIQKLKNAFTSAFDERKYHKYSDYDESTSSLINVINNNVGFEQLESVKDYLKSFGFQGFDKLEFDPTLARGLSYYTGCIFEVKVNNVQMGSISGGGRYDNLTGMFGLPDVSGVGFSFGVDRIYDVMEELQLFDTSVASGTKVLITNFDKEAELYALPILQKFREAGIAAELYPEAAKLKKQMTYADNNSIPFVLLIGSQEMESGLLNLKNMQTGQQETLPLEKILERVKPDSN